ncbi:unnamed protein product [Brassicogethes aeneus]|uniref:Uncharacterized protein n=1 Tax=Brassicogethes aeneus TaxID=1431903 RepID=A0A9P0FDG4_BRAAE|nr:unnamed protein product [Brassicogethes aeneus]
MPDVTRSDSQRSDVSSRPRVSFNRDVHVKRIVPREGARIVGALSGDGAGHLVASPVRKERLKKSKKELAEEAARVLHQADKIDCVTNKSGVRPDKFYTLPNRKKQRPEFVSASLDRRVRRNSSEPIPPRKPPRTFATLSTPHVTQKTSIFDIFKKAEKPKKSNLRRSVSDATNLKSVAYGANNEPFRNRPRSDNEDPLNVPYHKKQLSPIIEVTQREDYFSNAKADDKENIQYNDNVDIRAPARKKGRKSESVTEKLKQYIDEVDAEIYKETGVRVTPPKQEVKQPEVIIIDVDKAEKISSNKGKNSIGKKLKNLTLKKNKTNEAKSKPTNDKNKNKKAQKNNQKNVEENVEKKSVVPEKPKLEEKLSSGSVSTAPIIKKAIESLENPGKKSPTMIHSSQKPVEKLPLTKGRTVDTMVKRLSTDSASPPPKASLILGSAAQHGHSQPFSYTRGISPEKYMSNENLQHPSSPIIYAQVVCGKNGTNAPTKQTIHTAYQNGKKQPHSDSDEGLGYEENTGFNRKYEPEKPITHFGDRYNNNRHNSRKRTDDFFDEIDKFEEESPITPRFTNPAFLNGYNGYDRNRTTFQRVEKTGYMDSSSRGRGDGMDSKRRESLTEPFENGFTSNGVNGRSDLSARRDLLESRMNRRLNDISANHSPEYNGQPANVYVSESSSKYYRSGSASPVGYKEKYVSETKTDKNGERYTTESRSKKYFGDHPKDIRNGHNYSSFENEPKSFDSQISDYRSSPENRQFEASHNRYNVRSEKQKIFKDRDHYKSTPEIHHQRDYTNGYRDSYHESLKREKHDDSLLNSSKYRSERYLDHSESERKDKFGDSGIENDFRRDSSENYRVTRPPRRRDYGNESEDEGFASSLLIASERQHTEDSINSRKKKEYDSDRALSREEESIILSKHRSQDYVPRERSIDDGSHFDPRIDKDLDRSTLKKIEKKPPKPEKKSSLEKMKQLFTRDSKKKKEKQPPAMVREESLRARYVEYKGRDVEPKYKKKDMSENYSVLNQCNKTQFERVTITVIEDVCLRQARVLRVIRNETENQKPPTEAGSNPWTGCRERKTKRDGNQTSTEEDSPAKPTPTKNLRFFGDTDIESNDSTRVKSSFKSRPGIMSRGDRFRSQSSRDLHNISEEIRTPDLSKRKSSYKSMTNISETDRDLKGSKQSLKPPKSPNHRITREVSSKGSRDDRVRRRKNEVSSVESSTEGDSSQQSQRSIVYLHAATVGDIPGPGYLRNGRRAASREELASNSSSRMTPQVKTLSRSFSVLAPWKPRHYREAMDIDYTQYPKQTKNGKYEKVSKNGSSRKDSSSTLKKKAQETRRNQTQSTLTRKSKSKENLATSNFRKSNGDLARSSNSTLYKKKEKLPRENSRYSRDREEKKISSKSLSVESLGSNRSGRRSRDDRDVSRSVSMPRDPEKSAGWFKMTKKSKHTGSTQRL